MKMLLAIGGAIGLLTSSVYAVNPTIVVGNHVLIPNLAGQTFPISVSGGTAVAGVDFNAQIAGGGVANGGTAGPIFGPVDLTTGTIFANNNTGQKSPPSMPPQVFSGVVITNNPPTVSASGLLGTVTIDTTGFIGGTYSFKMAGFSNGMITGDTDFVAADASTIPATVTNGNLIVTFPGDTNLDGVVNAVDAITMARNYPKLSGATWAQGDFNGDGKIDINDANLLKQYWNRSININPGVPAFEAALSPAAVPEPATIGMGALALAGVALRRRRAAQ